MYQYRRRHSDRLSRDLAPDMGEAGFYTIEVTASGINPLTGQEIRLCKTHSVWVG